MTPLVSIVVPMYNAEKTIENTINSIFCQSYSNYEVIVVNDGSTDNSLQVLNKLLNKEERSQNFIIIDQNNNGVSVARNLGIKASCGEFIAFLDSDDEWLSNKLERQINILLDNPNIDFLGCNRNEEHLTKVLWKKFDILTKISAKFLLIKFVFVVPTIIFKRSIVLDLGYFDENQRYAEEGNYFIRISNKYNCYLLNESLVVTGGGKAHFGASGLSGNLKEMEKGELKNITYAYKLGVVNFGLYLALNVFSILKYIRRILIVKSRKYA